MKLSEMSEKELKQVKAEAEKRYAEVKAENLSLNMARGKPSPEQLDFSNGLLTCLNKDNILSENGLDCRNYGGLDGIPEAKKLFAPMTQAPEENTIVFGNSSLNIMFWVMQMSFTHGILGEKPLSLQATDKKLKFLCPVPGYDRHFAITELFGFELVNIPYKEDGPDMDLVRKYVENDDSVKGIWCVPQFSNPTGISYSEKVIKEFANLKPAAKDFRIYWDNAYTVHFLTDDHSRIISLYDECVKAGNPNIAYIFASTSKITYPGAGVAVMASGDENIKSLKNYLKYATISYDKVNQMRHVRFFDGKFENLLKHMELHQKSLAPKFEKVYEVLDREVTQLGIGTFTKPLGGYFISFDSMNGCAKRIVELCKNAGVTLTGAGNTYPYKKDPDDKNIRIAPSYPTVEELEKAMEVFALCVKIASCEKLLNK